MKNKNPGIRNAGYLQRLSEQQCQRLFDACLEILARTGVRIYEQEALDLLKKGGASITEGNRVRLTPQMVEKALASAPREFTLYDRYGNAVMPVGDRNAFFGPGSDCLHIIDHRTGQKRQALMRDVVDGMRVAEVLEHIDFVMCMFLPADVPQSTADRYQMEAMLSYSSKPVVFVTTELSGCIDAVEMAEAVAGGPEALRQKPQIACYINVTTGLVHNEEALQKLLYLSGKGLPTTYIPSTQGGVTAPVTPAGALIVAQAGALVGLVLSQLNREGAPFIMPGWGGNMLDMRTTVQPYADPDKRVMAADLVHYLGLPMFALAGCSDAKTVDQQAAAEAALTLMTDALCGANIVHDLGYLESGLTGSLVQLAICDEIVGWLEHLARPVQVDEESLALDLIDEIGPDGNFIESDHTFDHFRQRWYPSLFERDNYEGWLGRGGKLLAERAGEKVIAILDEDSPAILHEDTARRIRAVVERAESNAGGQA